MVGSAIAKSGPDDTKSVIRAHAAPMDSFSLCLKVKTSTRRRATREIGSMLDKI